MKKLTTKGVMRLLLESEILGDAKDFYGIDIEPRGKELYLSLEKIRKKNPDLFQKAQKEMEKKYGGAFSRTEAWYAEWRKFRKRMRI